MSRWDSYMVEKVPKNSGPPPFRAKEKGFSYVRCSLMSETTVIYCEFISQIKTVRSFINIPFQKSCQKKAGLLSSMI